MGAHPKAPSLVETDNGWESLETLIRNDPAGILGEWVARRFQKRLPFLFKVLAAAAPLSVQAHPNKEQARKGFAAENRLGISMDAPHRNYRDDNHKPECLCAVEPFLALCGFRKISGILTYMGDLALPELEPALADLRRHPDRRGLKRFFQLLMGADPDFRHRLIQGAVEASSARSRQDPAYEWVVRLNKAYPGDIGVLSPLLLNLVRLEPGQALFLPAGELHAYLEGVGIELMANSDNVLRGGLTSKHVDGPELMATLNFEEREVEILTPRIFTDVERIYPGKAAEFRLSVLHLTEAGHESIFGNDGIQILLCVEGRASFSIPGQEGAMRVDKGHAVLVPGGVNAYRIRGRAAFFKASTPRRQEGMDEMAHPSETL